MNSNGQQCSECGRPTAPGTRRFSDRRVLDQADGSRTYLCAECDRELEARDESRQQDLAERDRQVEVWITGAISGRPSR